MEVHGCCQSLFEPGQRIISKVSHIYIYIYIESDFNEYTSNRGTVILHLVQGATIKKVAPYNWHHANWDPMKQFIKAEIESGRFIPNFPLDF